jgi:hypothetical protein
MHMATRSRRKSVALLGAVAATAVVVSGVVVAQASAVAAVPRPDHVVIVLFENTAEESIIGNPDAPYFNQLADTGANFTNSFAIEHPSQPNYLDLFSGSNQGVTSDSCPHTFDADNEGAQLIAAGLTFTGYSEDLPSPGSTDCTAGDYARKHAPWVNFSNVPTEDNQPFDAFPTDYSTLPTVSWVIPNLCNDMHDCSIGTGNNQIPTIINGQPIKPGAYDERIDHFSVLRTVEDMYGLPHAGAAEQATPITDAWTG